MRGHERVWPDVAIPPGAVLAETIEARGISQAELARRMGRPAQAVNEIVQGTKEITAETALQLEHVLGAPAYVWTRLEADYRFNVARLAEDDRLRGEILAARKYPYGAMAKLGWVSPIRRAVDRVKQLLGFFGVASLARVPMAQPAVFRRSATVRESPEALAAWLRKGELLAQQVKVSPFDGGGLARCLPELRAMTLQRAEVFEPRLRATLSQRGVAFVMVPHLPGTGAHGATRWFGDKAVLQMSLRYAWADVFWFTLLHEVGHLLRHARRATFIEWERASSGRDGEEHEANKFAGETLIAASAYEQFRAARRGIIGRSDVVAFARAQGIAPGIVVGRLQHDRAILPSHLNELRQRFTWAKA